MLSSALAFFVLAIVAAILGFWGLAGVAAAIAKILFFVFIALFLVRLLFELGRGHRPPAV